MNKFQKTLILISLLTLLAVSAAAPRKSRLEIINKSGMDIAVRLEGEEEEEFYYLRVSEGDRQDPTTETFTIVRDRYQATVFFLETYDPVYGFECPGRPTTALNGNRNTRLVVKTCGGQALKTGEKTRGSRPR